jgi:hypothetical protein
MRSILIPGHHTSSLAPSLSRFVCGFVACFGTFGLTGCGQADNDGGAVAQDGGTQNGGSAAQAAGNPNGSGGSPANGGASGGTGLGGKSETAGTAAGGSSGITPSGGAPSTGGSVNGGTTGGGGVVAGGAGTAAGGGSGDVTIVPDPSWTCGMADGIPAPASGTLAFTVSLTLSATHNVGNTQYGKRRQLDVSGGSITGDKLKGTVQSGGLDYELTLSNGAMELEEVLIYKTSDNTSIFVRNCGVAAPGDSVVRIVPDIEAPTASSYAWLNTTKLVGTRTVAGDKLTLEIYDVSSATASLGKVQLKDPLGVPNTSWDCVSGSGTKGDSVFTENVTLGTTFGVNNAKRGSRNIIPITGGTTTGKVAGKILNGGADYQLAGSAGTTLDARYTLAPDDGAFIIVRNCGPGTSLVPAFEAAVDGPYKFLNEGKFLSSAPGAGAGGVSITFYERK